VCELFAISAEKPVNLRFSLDRLARRGGHEAKNCDGWGVAAYEDQDVYLAREPHPASESALIKCMQEALPPSRLVISHLRQATFGARSLSNTQPFVRVVGGRKQVFAHNGDIPEINLLDEPTPRWRPVGETDSEQAFSLLLRELEPVWAPEEPPPLADRLAVVEAFASMLQPLGPANFVYSDGDYLFVHGHERTQPDGAMAPPGLHLLHRDDAGCGVFVGDGVSARCPGGDAILIASIPLTEGPWEALAGGELLVLRRGRVVSRQIVGSDRGPS
jgi:predicted glutamine amidotransferase